MYTPLFGVRSRGTGDELYVQILYEWGATPTFSQQVFRLLMEDIAEKPRGLVIYVVACIILIVDELVFCEQRTIPNDYKSQERPQVF
jgi:hypothetical protein